jgi:hypothetical protein
VWISCWKNNGLPHVFEDSFDLKKNNNSSHLNNPSELKLVFNLND